MGNISVDPCFLVKKKSKLCLCSLMILESSSFITLRLKRPHSLIAFLFNSNIL